MESLTSGLINITTREETLAVAPTSGAIINLLFCILLVIITVVGSICVVVAVYQSKALQAPQYTLIVSLAIADMLVGLTVRSFVASSEPG